MPLGVNFASSFSSFLLSSSIYSWLLQALKRPRPDLKVQFGEAWAEEIIEIGKNILSHIVLIVLQSFGYFRICGLFDLELPEKITDEIKNLQREWPKQSA